MGLLLLWYVFYHEILNIGDTMAAVLIFDRGDLYISKSEIAYSSPLLHKSGPLHPRAKKLFTVIYATVGVGAVGAVVFYAVLFSLTGFRCDDSFFNGGTLEKVYVISAALVYL
jgi:hypothetical protein